MKNIVGLQLEISLVPLYEAHSLLDDMLQNLKEKGFELWGISTVFSDPHTAQLLQIDATFFCPKTQSSKRSITIAETNLNSRNIRKSALVFFKAILYYIFDSFPVLGITPPQKNSKKTVLLIRQDKIGDFILWLDTAKQYKEYYSPDKYKIILLGNSLWCDLAKELPYWDEVIPVNQKQFKTISRYRRRILNKVHDLKAEIAIQPTFSREFYHGDSLARASGAIRNIGSVGDMSNRNWLKKWLAGHWHTELIPASPEPQTELERNVEFITKLSGLKHSVDYPKLETKEAWYDSEHGMQAFYVLVPSASLNSKKWPIDNFAALAEKIYQRTSWNGVICGTKKEHLLGEDILKKCNAPLKNTSGQTGLQELAGLLSQSQLIISNDTGTAHIASAVGTTTVCILGGGHFGRFAPYPNFPGQTKNFHSVYHKMACYGCNWECIYSLKKDETAPCVSKISVDAVWNEVKLLLKLGKI
jgi:ADP-heptose:LPS heptosyltransferase